MKSAVRRLPSDKLALFVALAAAATLAPANQAAADEQRVSRLGLAIYAGVSSLSPDNVNQAIDQTNQATNAILGVAPIDHITSSPLFQMEVRFFVSDKIVAVMGLGSMRTSSSLQLMPQADTDLEVEGSVRAVPLHLGADYYFLPYTRGDFTLRPFAGGGFMSSVDTRVKVGASFTAPDTTVDQFQRFVGNGAGFYLEGGVHAMVPSRYSFILNLFYRNLQVKRLYIEDGDANVYGLLLDENGNPAKLDLSGFGIRLGVNMNILNRF